MGIRCFALLCVVGTLVGCDLQSRKSSKLPSMPAPPQAVTKAADPTFWAKQGDSMCPSISVAQTVGAPGTTVREGRVTRDPSSGSLRCQVDGRNHGPATDIDPDGTMSSGNYQTGLRTGQWEGRFADGRLAWKGGFIEGLQVGQWTHWDADGDLVTTGELRNGKRHGMWLFWDRPVKSSGDATRFEVYREGTPGRNGIIIDGKPVLSRPLCALGYSAPRCWSILAAGLTYRRGPDNRTDGGNANSLSIDGAFTANVVEGHGIGIGGSIYVGDEFARFGARAAYRYYVAHVIALEASGGFLFAREDLDVRTPTLGQHARFEVIFGDQLALGTELARFDHDGDGENKHAAFVTVRIGLIPLATAAYVLARIGGR